MSKRQCVHVTGRTIVTESSAAPVNQLHDGQPLMLEPGLLRWR